MHQNSNRHDSDSDHTGQEQLRVSLARSLKACSAEAEPLLRIRALIEKAKRAALLLVRYQLGEAATEPQRPRANHGKADVVVTEFLQDRPSLSRAQIEELRGQVFGVEQETMDGSAEALFKHHRDIFDALDEWLFGCSLKEALALHVSYRELHGRPSYCCSA
jgi:hypothetical protein